MELNRYPMPDSYEWHIATLLEYGGINCVFDVGANRGQYARILRKIGYRGWIVSFEPVPAVFEELGNEFRRDPKWRGFPVALAEREGTQKFHVARGDGQASSLLTMNEEGPKRWGEDHTVKEIIEVSTRRLDSIWNECVSGIDDPRVFLKMDSQGYDLKIVEGARARINQVLAIQSELAMEHFYEGMISFTDAVKSYESLGFDPVGFFPLSRRVPDFLRVVEFDAVFMRKGIGRTS